MAMLALITLCFAQLPARAQHSGTHALYQDIFIPAIGLAPGQSLRLTLFNPDGAPVRAQARLHHTGGILVGMADGSVRAGAFHWFDFHRSDISLPGEAGTGRIQLLASVRLTFSEAIQPVLISMETHSITDGTSNTIFFSEVIPTAPGSGGGNDLLVGGGARDILMGIVPGQTLRITLFNPQAPGSDYVPSRVILFEKNGRQIVQSPELVIPPGEFRSFDINYEALPLLSGAPAGRRQIRARLEAGGDPRAPALLLPSAELIDSAGKTTVLTGHQCLVFYLGGMPDQSDR
jgi:hypothetical protein